MKIDMREGSTWTLDEALHVAAHRLGQRRRVRAGGERGRQPRPVRGDGHRPPASASACGTRRSRTRPASTAPRASAAAPRRARTTSRSSPATRSRSRPSPTPPSKVTTDFTDPNGVGRHLVNHNKGFLTGYPGAIGLKTGYTKAASRTLLAAARRDGHTLHRERHGHLGRHRLGRLPARPVLRRRPRRRRARRSRRCGPRPCRTASTRSRACPTRSARRRRGTAAATAAAATPSRATRAHHRGARRPQPTAAADRRRRRGRDRERGRHGLERPDSGWSLGSILRTAGLVLLGLLVIVVLLRRRAVKRQRARRIARMRGPSPRRAGAG